MGGWHVVVGRYGAGQREKRREAGLRGDEDGGEAGIGQTEAGSRATEGAVGTPRSREPGGAE